MARAAPSVDAPAAGQAETAAITIRLDELLSERGMTLPSTRPNLDIRRSGMRVKAAEHVRAIH
jgi:hypothetical protein